MVAVIAFVVLGSCKSAPPPKPVVATPPPPPVRVVPVDTKVAWMIRLEHQRLLRDSGAAASDPGARFDSAPDLEVLARDADPALRRRALLSIGRVGDASALPALVKALSDPDEGVRTSAAFSIGILGAPGSTAPLVDMLKDPSPVMRGRVAEALGLLGDGATAAAVATAFSDCGAHLAPIASDDERTVAPEAEACRLALFALVRLRQYEALARVALDPQGAPVSRWWPVAYALQRIGDARALGALSSLASTPGVYTPSFALRGLAALRDSRAVDPATAIAGRREADVRVRAAAVRALGELRAAAAVPALLKVLDDTATPRNLALEVVTALGAIGDRRALDSVLDRLTDRWAAMRAAAFASAAKIDPDGFLLVFSGFEPDRDWSVRASVAAALGALPPDRVRAAVMDLVNDPDVRVQGPALEALARVGGPDVTPRLFAALDAPDFAVRATAARLIGAARVDGGVARLEAAYTRAESDVTPAARTATLEALAQYGASPARPTLTAALRDRDWAVRRRAAELLRELGDPTPAPARPGPLRQRPDFFESDTLLHPPFAPHAFIETERGTLEIELNVTDAPLTSLTFIELARAGFFNGVKVHRLVPNFVIQAGDPRGDGAGGPGYAIRDELSPLPFVRGTVGLAIDGRDSGGSQFFITLSPQPHLDGRYTVFGRVVQGFDRLDEITQWDVIERVRIWDGVKAGMPEEKKRGR
jgi:cyclophilin family peptidyl-prolyl cis-trans isomerase